MFSESRAGRGILAVAVLALTALASCERKRAPAPSDTAGARRSPSAVGPTVPAIPSAWDTSAGSVLFVHGSDTEDASIVFPQFSDSMLPDTVHFDWHGVRGATLDLFARGGRFGDGRVQAVNGSDWTGDHCTDWPTASITASHVRPEADSSDRAMWTVALYSGRAQAVPLDSIEGMARVDSARLAAELARLTSALPDDTARTFRGIPASVRVAYRFHPTPGVDAVVADVVRRLNLEANPLEQHTFVIAERDPGGSWHVAYHERAAGSEESIEITDVLATISIGSPPRVMLFVMREGLESSAYASLERDPSGSWRLRWTSAHTGC